MKLDFTRSVVQYVVPDVHTCKLSVGRHRQLPVSPRPLDGLVLVLSGSAVFHTQPRAVSANAGDVLFLSRGSRYFVEVKVAYEHIWIDFMLTRTDDRVDDCCSFSVTEKADVERIFQQLRHKSWNMSASACMMRLSLVYELLAILAKEDMMDYISMDRRTKVEEARRFIDQHISDETFTCRDLARNMGISDVHFRRLFLKMFGQTPAQYLTSSRLTFAKEKLMDTDEPIRKIAQDAGFGNQNYFSRVFRREYGMTPTDYRSSYH